MKSILLAVTLGHLELNVPARGDFEEGFRVLGEHGSASGRLAISPSPQAQAARNELAAVLNPRYTFDGFVIGASNRFAHAATLAVAERPAKSWNTLL